MLLSNRHRTIDPQKDTQFSDAWIVLAILILATGLVLDNAFLTTAAILLLVVAGIGRLWAALSLFGVHYRRRFSEVRAFQGETIELVVEVTNRKFLPLTWLIVRDHFPPNLPVIDHALPVNPLSNLAEFNSFWMPGPFQRITRRFQIECTERGFHRYGPVELRTGDGFGFFGRSAQQEYIDRLIVYPRLYTVAELGLPTKNPFGEKRVRGKLLEDPAYTAGVRAWQATDSLQRVHWKASARHQQLLSRQHEPSEEEQLLIFLNVATLERHWHGYLPELQERTISVAGSLAALAAEQRLPVGLIANGALPGSDQPIRLLPGRSPNQLMRILELLAAVTPFTTAPIEHMLRREAPRLPWGSTLVLVTAIAHEELLAALLDLAAVGRRLVLFTLAEAPPRRLPADITVYHLPHLVDDLVAPRLVQAGV